MPKTGSHRLATILPALVAGLAVFVLAACQSATVPDRFTLNAPALEPDRPADYGVVLGTVAPVPTPLGVVADDGEVAFEVDMPAYMFTDTKGRIPRAFFLDDDLARAATPPGTYRIAHYRLPSDRVTYHFPNRLRAPEASGLAGRFRLQPGEVIYVGHLVFKPEGDSLHMEVEDRFETFRDRLPADLAARVTKRLIALPGQATFSETGRFAIERETRFNKRHRQHERALRSE